MAENTVLCYNSDDESESTSLTTQSENTKRCYYWIEDIFSCPSYLKKYISKPIIGLAICLKYLKSPKQILI